MRGVDVVDQYRHYYTAMLNSYKWWHKCLTFVVDSSLLNCFIIYHKDATELGLGIWTLQVFYFNLAKALVALLVRVNVPHGRAANLGRRGFHHLESHPEIHQRCVVVVVEAVLCATSLVSCKNTCSHGLPTSCAIEASVILGERVCFLPNYSTCLLIVLACEAGMLCSGSKKVAHYYFCHCQHQPLLLSCKSIAPVLAFMHSDPPFLYLARHHSWSL